MKTTSQKIKSFQCKTDCLNSWNTSYTVSASTASFYEVLSITRLGICHLGSDFWVMDLNKSSLQMAAFHNCIQFQESCYLILLLFSGKFYFQISFSLCFFFIPFHYLSRGRNQDKYFWNNNNTNCICILLKL